MVRNFDSSAPPIVNQYFRWLVKESGVDITSEPDLSYLLLMRTLFKKTFYWSVDDDKNRAYDGTYLRELFYEEAALSDILGPATVLEVLVGIATRMEHDILGDPAQGDHVHTWFWEMIENLGLDRYSDDKFDVGEVIFILDKWMDRDYSRNGRGGIFFTDNTGVCMNEECIRWQMQVYAMEKYGDPFTKNL